MARMPGAIWLGEHSPKRLMARYDIVCVHTIVGYAPAHAAHFSVKKDGTILQSRDTKYQSAANLDGNPRVIAIENEDAAQDIPLSPEQVVSNARIMAWAHQAHGVPLQLAPNSKPTSRGLAYHRQGIDGNFGGYRYPGRVSGGEKWSSSFGKICPRDKRIAQVPEILSRAKAIVNPPEPPPPPVTTHTRWATKMTGVHATPGGKKLRDIPAGYKFQVIDGSGHGNDGWIETSAGNWVLGADTTIWDPAAPVQFSVMDWNVENKGDADAALDRAEIIKLVAEHKPHFFALQEVYRVDLADIPGYQTYRAWDGYSVDSENRAQALLVRNDVAIKVQQAIAMTEEWTGPKMGLAKEPRVHRYVTGNYHGKNIPVATFHVPFGAAAVEETEAAAIDWLTLMKQSHGRGVIDGDWNSLADDLQAKVGDPAGAIADGGGRDRAVFIGLKKIKGENLGNRGRSDHPVKKRTFEA